MGQILDECVESAEKCWWGDGEEKPFHPNLITLAEKLGFNVEKFSKITGPSGSANQSWETDVWHYEINEIRDSQEWNRCWQRNRRVIHLLIKGNTEVMAMNVVKATVKGQILIPASLRRKYKIERGTPLRVYGRKNHIVLEPVVRDPVEEGRGMLKTKGRILKSLIEDRKREAKQWSDTF
jgi:bifunctional DNA-binding transcriptional regulator/antitoxin component of YhaV-PrlF toxin-antitoxin module